MPDIRASGGTYFLGRYRVVDEIGIGGMASVHLARMDGPGGFQKWVAIKKIHPHLVEDDSFVQMFLDEARVAAKISHPNVATVFDLGKHEETYWIAMEYLHGEPLREVMRRTEELGTAMPPEIACRVIAEAGEGLHAAHELLGKNGEKLGLVHRDVTPHNLFVTYDGVTKVVDFGIAKFSSRMSHTRAGTLKGKLAYMSPEQVHGEGIDRRTDIFALGVVLWELTTGQRLFRMESDLDTLAKVQECNVPRPSTLIRGYPVDLEKIVMKALAKNRGERFRTAREFSRALQSLLMRRGLFIASDEVASYTQSIFTDRIQKREAHLRWAAEVTQTINVEQMLSKPKLGPEFTNSDVQAAGPPQGGKAVRPAAGAPASHDPDLLSLKETGPSLPTAPRAPSSPPNRNHAPPLPSQAPLSNAPRGPAIPRPQTQDVRLRPDVAKPPRPAAGAPPPSYDQPPPISEEEPHPADGDGPTIQALPPMEEPFTSSRSEPPTLLEAHGSVVSPALGPALGRPPHISEVDADELQRLHDDDLDDGDETIVAKDRRPEPHPLNAPPMFPPRDQGARPPPGRLGTQRPQPPAAPMSPVGVGPAGPFGPPSHGHPQQHAPYPAPSAPRGSMASHGELAFSDTLGVGSPYALQPIETGDFGRPQSIDGYPRVHAPTGHSGEFIPRAQQQQRFNPTVPRTGPNGFDNRTMTAQRFKRRPPMWVVAALSCSIALLIAGLVIVIVSTTSNPTPPRSASGPAAASGSGPFTTTRAQFNQATTPGPASPTGAAGSGAPPASTAVAGATPPATGGGSPAPEPSSTTTIAAASAPVAPATYTPPPAPSPTTTSASAANTTRPQPTPAPAPAPQPTAKKSGPAALGAITVVCMPKCDQIIDNGTPLGPGHIFNRPVPAGRHVLVLSAPNGVKKNLQVEVSPEQTREVRISMDK